MLRTDIDIPKLLELSCSDNGVDKYTTSVLLRRLAREGSSFWITTLPKFSKAVISSIEQGMFVRPAELPEFKFLGNFPTVFSRLTSKLFNLDGTLAVSDPSALKSIRNVCERLSKLAVAYSPEIVQASLNDYAELQQEVIKKVEQNQFRDLNDIFRTLLKSYYGNIMNLTVSDLLDGIPRYGPGSLLLLPAHKRRWQAAQNRTKFHLVEPLIGDTHSSKYKQDEHLARRNSSPQEWKRAPIELRQPVLPAFAEYADHFINDGLEPISDKIVSDITDRACQLCLVPKTAKGPRVISKEMPEIIFPQMAFHEVLKKSMSGLFGGVMNLSDQSRNRELAREGSINGEMSTIDLSSASDMVSFGLCRATFRDTGIGYFLENARASTVLAPPGEAFWAGTPSATEAITLGAVGGMGSGLTFPLLSLICHLACCYGIWLKNPDLEYGLIAAQVSVYGDDIVLPTKWANQAIDGLVSAGLKPNLDKTFKSGLFRESCGGDYLSGVDVAPIRMKLSNADLPEVKNLQSVVSISNIEGLYQLNKHAAELFADGQLESAMYLESLLEQVGIPMPVVGLGFAGFGRVRSNSYEIVDQFRFTRERRVVQLSSLSHRRLAGSAAMIFVSSPAGIFNVKRNKFHTNIRVWTVRSEEDSGFDRYAKLYSPHMLIRNACKGTSISILDDLTAVREKGVSVHDPIQALIALRSIGPAEAEQWGVIPTRRALKLEKKRVTKDELLASI